MTRAVLALKDIQIKERRKENQKDGRIRRK